MASARDFVDGSTYSSRGYAPVSTEHDHANLELLEGEIPAALRGVFARNSSNPKFPPPEPYHWFDGDGMVHAVSFEDGGASYRNRWVRTAGLAEDEAAGAATWTGLLARPDMTRPGGPYKNTANTDLLYWNGRLLALWWLGGGQPYALSLPDLSTVGPWPEAGTMTAHAKVDPRSGDLVFLDYAPTSARVTHGTLTCDGQLTRTPVELPGPRPQHDLALTEHYTILIDVSMFPDPEALARGKVHMSFFPDVPTRLGVFDRRTQGVKHWFEVPACYVYHFVNAWELGTKIVVTVCRMRDPLVYEPQPGRSDRVVPRIGHLRLEPQLVRWTLDLETGLAREDLLDDGMAEFPRVDDRRLGSPTRVAYLGSFAAREAFAFDGVRRVDLDSGAVLERRYPPGWCGGEVSVAPLGDAEDEVALLTFVSEEDGDASELWVMAGRDLEVLARLAIPTRVPAGFHTQWVGADALAR
ncbi:carotenoid oxygenase family protein [Enhygromyxa salina]|uniref:Carotenoid cleavage oxygenase n=1 Tax=Enhygromyxa salina TaxID=215803 RepID=A0A2S9YWH4_9BACT|nr:carotenoid oxygenase family protein [Enhygromyxa salina]PRQ09440.1 Carotenoid cleavage oxygenase [Enhygromyxa salina]